MWTSNIIITPPLISIPILKGCIKRVLILTTHPLAILVCTLPPSLPEMLLVELLAGSLLCSLLLVYIVHVLLESREGVLPIWWPFVPTCTSLSEKFLSLTLELSCIIIPSTLIKRVLISLSISIGRLSLILSPTFVILAFVPPATPFSPRIQMCVATLLHIANWSALCCAAAADAAAL